jgi:hypothetical protein
VRRPYQADIDPSFPGRAHKQKILADDLVGISVPMARWVRVGPSPRFEGYLLRKEHDGCEGPWLLVDAFFVRWRPSIERNAFATIFATIRAFFIKNEAITKARSLLRSYKVQSGWLSQILETREFFAGELPWSPAMPNAE